MADLIATPFAFGDIEKLKTAGVQSVQIAVPFSSARGTACFPIEEPPDIKAEYVCCQISMCVLVNRISVEEELEGLRDFLKLLKELDVEGIYYGDEGVLHEAARLDMKGRLIYNPDTLITNAMDMQYYLDEGIRMTTISKEITLQEMCTVARDVQGERGAILHGRLSMMHFKRRLLSAYMEFLGKEEAVTDNHQPYLMEETRGDRMPIVEDTFGTHVFTGFTLVPSKEIRELYEAGVWHFRIDGIFHDIEYVCEALRLYQDVLKGARDGRQTYQEYEKKYKEGHMSHGFYYTKTSKIKQVRA